MAIQRNSKINPNFNMSSMTDIFFLLLLFFMISSTLINPNALRLLLPKSTNQTSDKPVTVEYEGKTLFKGKVRRDAAIIARMLRERGDTRLVFSAEIKVEMPVAE